MKKFVIISFSVFLSTVTFAKVQKNDITTASHEQNMENTHESVWEDFKFYGNQLSKAHAAATGLVWLASIIYMKKKD